MNISEKKIAIVGGCGHVGLPLGVKFALAGADTKLIDIDAAKVALVNQGTFPFLEEDGDKELKSAISKGKLEATTDSNVCKNADVIVFVTGTPVDEHLNPKISDVLKTFDHYHQFFGPNTLVVMRSTLFPGTMEHISNRLKMLGVQVRLAFCPERVSQGYALKEIDELPQIVSSFNEESFKAASEIFSALAPCIIRLTPLEAEITKLMANSWRYLEFAIANQFYLIAEKNGVDFYRIYNAIKYQYPRANGYKAPGFAAGPCLFKDTMQLASYFDNQFFLGHSAMLVNENLASFVVDKAMQIVECSQDQNQQPRKSLWGKTVGLLGVAFKAENDDTRESLSFKVKKGLVFHGANVLWHDPFVAGSDDLTHVINKSDVLILCTPHNIYKNYNFSKPVVDVWGIVHKTNLEIFEGKQS